MAYCCPYLHGSHIDIYIYVCCISSVHICLSIYLSIYLFACELCIYIHNILQKLQTNHRSFDHCSVKKRSPVANIR